MTTMMKNAPEKQTQNRPEEQNPLGKCESEMCGPRK